MYVERSRAISSATPLAPLDTSDALATANRGATFETAGVALLVGGLVLAAAGTTLGLLLPVAAAPASGGGAVVVAGGTF